MQPVIAKLYAMEPKNQVLPEDALEYERKMRYFRYHERLLKKLLGPHRRILLRCYDALSLCSEIKQNYAFQRGFQLGVSLTCGNQIREE